MAKELNPWQRDLVEEMMRSCQRWSAAEVHRKLREYFALGDLTIEDVADFLDENYFRAGKKRCAISGCRVQYWSRHEREEPEWDMSNALIAKSAQAYD